MFLLTPAPPHRLAQSAALRCAPAVTFGDVIMDASLCPPRSRRSTPIASLGFSIAPDNRRHAVYDSARSRSADGPPRPSCLQEPTPSPYSYEEMSIVHDLSLDEIVRIDPDVMHGTPCFAGTRVPVETLLDYVAEGDTIDAFLADFPSVKRQQATGLLALAQERLVESLSSR